VTRGQFSTFLPWGRDGSQLHGSNFRRDSSQLFIGGDSSQFQVTFKEQLLD